MTKFLSDKEIKNIQLDILRDIDTFCKKNNIKYFINYGTLLGAVRHKGFIPWDDDIDLTMEVNDYNKFIDLYSKEGNKYRILSLKTDKKYFNNFIKIHDPNTRVIDSLSYKTYDSGIFIDIFPLNYFDNKKIINSSYFWESLKLISFTNKENIIHKDSIIKDYIRLSLWYLLKPVSPRLFAHIIERKIRKYSSNKPTFSAFIMSKEKDKEIFPLDISKELTNLEFEGLMLPAPKDYDFILKGLYGDYMELPPIEKRTNPHKIKVHYIER
ncbi:LicD family protein [Gemelliphila palaticanis]|uniref:LicD family protein n=1 Tax=Gemelliphila palaticanis TaxID=81950 RepID=A0ABX2SYL9_9BACL|nr:LicD family protein [Gemella palaticanis]MBF0715448.1 LicD family protein [Gemella palaticanis]NYS47378.1 LicD family protein [Gemella palaticanis]